MYDYIRIRLRQLHESERGASAVEYGLLVALIAAVIILAVVALGDTLNTVFTNTEATITNNTAP
jgi:pilus assembly protein Flp/PilA